MIYPRFFVCLHVKTLQYFCLSRFFTCLHVKILKYGAKSELHDLSKVLACLHDGSPSSSRTHQFLPCQYPKKKGALKGMPGAVLWLLQLHTLGHWCLRICFLLCQKQIRAGAQGNAGRGAVATKVPASCRQEYSSTCQGTHSQKKKVGD